MSSLESVLEEARKLPPEEQRELAEKLLAENEQPPAGERKPLWEKIEERIAQAPPGTWDDAPTDGSINVDHYLYGAPRR
jgi:hypothetical protein